jgi:HD superfamily phosphohydrolase YqeK
MRKKVDLKEAITMAQDNEYVQKLIAARDREVVHRRDIAERLAVKYNRGDKETIEAIERAVWHERYIAGQKSEPFSPFGFGS